MDETAQTEDLSQKKKNLVRKESVTRDNYQV